MNYGTLRRQQILERHSNRRESCMAKAIWKKAVLAESDRTVVVDGFTYFPLHSVQREYLRESDQRTT